MTEVYMRYKTLTITQHIKKSKKNKLVIVERGEGAIDFIEVGIEPDVLKMFGDIMVWPVVVEGKKNCLYCSNWMDKRKNGENKTDVQFCIML